MLEIRSGDIQIAATDIVDGFVVDEESAIGILDSAVSRQDSVVGLDNSGRDLWCRIDGEFELRFLAVIGRQALKQESPESRPCAPSKAMEDEESLK